MQFMQFDIFLKQNYNTDIGFGICIHTFKDGYAFHRCAFYKQMIFG